MSLESMDSAAVLTQVVLAVFEKEGESILKLKGNCMWPVLRNGDLVKICRTDFKELKYGSAAVFQTTPKTLHANVMFSPSGWGPEPANFLGQIVEIQRNGKMIALGNRSGLRILLETCACPSNPFFLGLPAFLFQKLRNFSKPRH